MRINDIVSETQIDELNAQDVGRAAAKGAKALGKGVKAVGGAVGSAAQGFTKGFAGEFTGKKSTPAAGAAPTAQKKTPMPGKTKSASGAMNLDSIKTAISKLNPKQQQALKQQLARA